MMEHPGLREAVAVSLFCCTTIQKPYIEVFFLDKNAKYTDKYMSYLFCLKDWSSLSWTQYQTEFRKKHTQICIIV